MLNYRRQERERKAISEEADISRASCPANQPFPGEMKDDDEVLRQYVADDRMNLALPTTTSSLLPMEIIAVEPFNAFPIKIERYMFELLSSCRCLPSFLTFFCLRSASRKRG